MLLILFCFIYFILIDSFLYHFNKSILIYTNSLILTFASKYLEKCGRYKKIFRTKILWFEEAEINKKKKNLKNFQENFSRFY